MIEQYENARNVAIDYIESNINSWTTDTGKIEIICRAMFMMIDEMFKAIAEKEEQ